MARAKKPKKLDARQQSRVTNGYCPICPGLVELKFLGKSKDKDIWRCGACGFNHEREPDPK